MVLDLTRETAEPARFLDDPHDDFGAMLSPDGRWIAYVSSRAGTSQVYLRAIDASRSGGLPIRAKLELDPSGPRARLGQRTLILESLALASEEEYGIAADGRVAMIELVDREKTGSRLRVVSGWLTELDRLLESD